MEKQLFTWEDWDPQDTFSFTFYDVTTTTQLGDIPAGTKFKYANLDYEQGILELFDGYDEQECRQNFHKFTLRLAAQPVQNETSDLPK